MDRYDVIIIGTGAGGGTLAQALAPTGKRILLLERGDFVPREKANWDPRRVNVEGRYQTKEVWHDREGNPLHPHTNYAVGGNTKFYGAALFRFRKEDFGELRHHGGTSPAWHISYEELEPYYLKAEHIYQVHGNRGEDPTEPEASGPYRHPAVSHEPRIQALSDSLASQGLTPFHVPLGIQLDERAPRTSLCIRCETCDGFPCLVRAKSDAEVLCVVPALRHPNVTLLTGAHVERLETDDSGREVTGVVVKRADRTERYAADLVVVSAGAINSAALLLRSANDCHPRGLANGSDVVGRHYMGHINSVLMALSRCPNPTVFQKTLAVNDFYFGMDGFAYPMGNIQMVGKSLGPMYRGEKPLETALLPMALLGDVAHHALDFWLTTEDLPDPENRVTVDGAGKLTLSYRPNNQVPQQMLYEKLKSMLGQLGMYPAHLIPRHIYMKTDIPIAGCAHQAGTCRFGTDAKSSVLDVNCKAHELDNLYVVDTSFFVSIGAVNPSLTAIANAIRVGDHLAQRLA